MSYCIGCTQAITQQKANDERTIQKARELAEKENKPIGLYRNEYGELCIATGPGSFPISHQVTPVMQHA